MKALPVYHRWCSAAALILPGNQRGREGFGVLASSTYLLDTGTELQPSLGVVVPLSGQYFASKAPATGEVSHGKKGCG